MTIKLNFKLLSINLFDTGTTLLGLTHIGHTNIGHTPGHVAWHTTLTLALLLVHFLHDRVLNTFDFLLLLVELLLVLELILIQPFELLINLFGNLFLILGLNFVLQIFVIKGIFKVKTVVFKTVFLVNLLLVGFIFLFVFFLLVNHSLDFGLGKPTFLVGNRDLLLPTRLDVLLRNVQDTVGVNVEGNLDLRNTPGLRLNTIKVEFSEQVVILGHLTLTLEHLDQDTGLVVLVGGESLLFLGGDGSRPLDQLGHNTTLGLEAHGKRLDINQQNILSLRTTLVALKNLLLYLLTVSNLLIGVNTLVGLLTVEKVLEQGLDLRDPS